MCITVFSLSTNIEIHAFKVIFHDTLPCVLSGHDRKCEWDGLEQSSYLQPSKQEDWLGIERFKSVNTSNGVV